MSVRRIKAGTTDVSVIIRIVDSSDGTPETGVVYNTSGIDLWYRREGAASVDITEATLAALTTAHTDGGFLHINDGWYRLDLPDAACASGVTGVQIGGTVTGMVVLAPYIELVAYDPYDTVRLGLTALPNAAADAAGGLVVSDAGGLDIDALNTNVSAILTDTAEIGAAGAGLTAIPWNPSWDAEVQSEVADGLTAYNAVATTDLPTNFGDLAITATTGRVDVASIEGSDATDQINAACDTALSDYDAPTKAELDSGLAGLNDPTAAAIADAVLDEALSGHVTAGTLGKAVADIEADTNELQSDDTPSALSTIEGKIDTIDGIVDAILIDTAEIGAAGAGLTEAGGTGDHLTAVPYNSAWDAEIQSECNDALVALHLDHLLAVDYDPASKPGTATALLNELVESDSGVSRFTANALEQAPSGSGSTPAQFWDYATSNATVSGSMGELLTDNVDAPISTVDTVVDGIKVVTDNLPDSGALTSIAQESTLGTPADTDIATDIANLLTGNLTEAYPSAAGALTLTTALYSMHQFLTEFAISGTTYTVKKRDGSTTAKTFTLDDATTPTSISETT